MAQLVDDLLSGKGSAEVQLPVVVSKISTLAMSEFSRKAYIEPPKYRKDRFFEDIFTQYLFLNLK